MLKVTQHTFSKDIAENRLLSVAKICKKQSAAVALRAFFEHSSLDTLRRAA